MKRKTELLFVLTAVALLLYATRFFPAVAMPVDLSDFFGGMAIGLGIGAAVTFFGER